MASCLDDVIGGWNSYVHELPIDSVVSLTEFDSQGIDLRIDRQKPADAMITEFRPRGNTPLYDAIGMTLEKIEGRALGFQRVAIVIATDGQENCSRAYTREQVAALLAAVQAKGWLVIYLGANQDAFAVGAGLHANQRNTATYDVHAMNATLRSAGAATARYARAATMDAAVAESAFTDAERESMRSSPRIRQGR
jgi:hypothetical protein